MTSERVKVLSIYTLEYARPDVFINNLSNVQVYVYQVGGGQSFVLELV